MAEGNGPERSSSGSRDAFRIAEGCDDQREFEAVASAYPHEVHDHWPDRFWDFFQRVRPGISREDMVRLLKETRSSEAVGQEDHH